MVESKATDGSSLSSLWDGLSEHLIASFYPVTKGQDGTWSKAAGGDTVRAPLTDATLEASLNWQSPFEQSGPESKAPALMAMLQSGEFQPIIDMIPGGGGGLLSSIKSKLSDAAGSFEGRTGITKLNSTQVFSGMPPVKIQVTALFRAWKNTDREVERPFDKLMEWALPVKLAADGSIIARLLKFASGEMGAVDALMPSQAPVCVAMKYKRRTYSPLVIESISAPLASPVDRGGRFVELAIPMTLCSLTAIDRADWKQWGQAVSL